MSLNPSITSLDIEIPVVMEVKIPRMTNEEFYAFCEENPELRVERDKDGKITIMSPVGLISGTQENVLGGELYSWNKKYRLGKCFSPSAGFTLPDTAIKSADAAWVSKENWQSLSKAERHRFGHLVPDFIAEVRSTSDSIKKLKEKVTDSWLENGVRLAWLIDPVRQKAYIFRQNGSVDVVESFDQTLSGEDVLPGFEFDLRLLLDEDFV